MSDHPNRSRTGAQARPRQDLRELSLKRREAYFDPLVSGYSVEQNVYRGVNVEPARLTPQAALRDIAPAAPLARSPGVAAMELFGDEKLCAKPQLSSRNHSRA